MQKKYKESDLSYEFGRNTFERQVESERDGGCVRGTAWREDTHGVSGQAVLRQQEQAGRGLSGVKKHFSHLLVK